MRFECHECEENKIFYFIFILKEDLEIVMQVNQRSWVDLSVIENVCAHCGVECE